MRWMVFGEIFGNNCSARFPKDVVMTLTNSILYPIKTHIHGFCEFLIHFVVDDTICGVFVSFHGCG